jgi:ATP-dependent helicase/nuclease subunit B
MSARPTGSPLRMRFWIGRMFEPVAGPRLFALPPGVDFAEELVAGLRARLAGAPPEAMARVTLIVNTRRMARRLTDLFLAGPATLLPRMALVGDPGGPPPPGPAEVPALTRQLELAGAVGQLIAAQPDLAPMPARFELARSLAALMDEMAGEGVQPDALARLDIGDHAAHWARARQFLDAIARAWAGAPGPVAGERRRAEHCAALWAAAPPVDPVILAGSTGSRGATALLMRAVAGLPQGALVLPGFDAGPARAWAALDRDAGAEDHPQYRFHALLTALGAGPGDVRPWTRARPPNPARNRLVGLALRPAPVTDAWRAEAPAAEEAAAAADGLTLIEAPDPRTEAQAIALILRAAAEGDTRAALITPDRVLARRVAAALDRWRIVPDDSAGEPLDQAPPGRFLRLLARMLGQRIDAETLLALLKHPLTHSGTGADRHGLYTARLEARLRRHGPAFPDAAALRADRPDDPDEAAWREWLADRLAQARAIVPGPLAAMLATHRDLAQGLAAGPGMAGAGALWEAEAGAAALAAMDRLAEAAPAGGEVTPADLGALLDTVLAAEEVRSPVESHPLDADPGHAGGAGTGGSDRAILGGLNDGGWPALPAAGPLAEPGGCAAMLGLLLPERRIGLCGA